MWNLAIILKFYESPPTAWEYTESAPTQVRSYKTLQSIAVGHLSLGDGIMQITYSYFNSLKYFDEGLNQSIK